VFSREAGPEGRTYIELKNRSKEEEVTSSRGTPESARLPFSVGPCGGILKSNSSLRQSCETGKDFTKLSSNKRRLTYSEDESSEVVRLLTPSSLSRNIHTPSGRCRTPSPSVSQYQMGIQDRASEDMDISEDRSVCASIYSRHSQDAASVACDEDYPTVSEVSFDLEDAEMALLSDSPYAVSHLFKESRRSVMTSRFLLCADIDPSFLSVFLQAGQEREKHLNTAEKEDKLPKRSRRKAVAKITHAECLIRSGKSTVGQKVPKKGRLSLLAPRPQFREDEAAGLRRSRRRKVAPLDFWRNERFEYARGTGNLPYRDLCPAYRP
jgi:hypothetical protein